MQTATVTDTDITYLQMTVSGWKIILDSSPTELIPAGQKTV